MSELTYQERQNLVKFRAIDSCSNCTFEWHEAGSTDSTSCGIGLGGREGMICDMHPSVTPSNKGKSVWDGRALVAEFEKGGKE